MDSRQAGCFSAQANSTESEKKANIAKAQAEVGWDGKEGGGLFVYCVQEDDDDSANDKEKYSALITLQSVIRRVTSNGALLRC